MARGSKPGERRGGRKPGVTNKKTKEIADRAMESGITPLEVMLEAMQHLHGLAREEKDPEKRTKLLSAAAEEAARAAPYIHPRLQSTDHSVKGTVKINIMH